jgi:hypothetical protein
MEFAFGKATGLRLRVTSDLARTHELTSSRLHWSLDKFIGLYRSAVMRRTTRIVDSCRESRLRQSLVDGLYVGWLAKQDW